MDRGRKPLAVYIHIPFCAQKCLYCDFVSAPAGEEEIARYIRVLIKEIRGMEPIGALRKVHSVFFGGGTPSLIDPVHIENILETLRAQYRFADDAEITIECNPGTVTREKLRRYHALGINRLSFGLQSVHEEELRRLGRIHTYQDFQDNYEEARRAGFDNINIDLMSALPYQTMAKWQRTLKKTADLEPEHISAYSLSIEEGTPFFEKYGGERGKRILPGEDKDRQMYAYTKEFLGERGYTRYEISNYAKAGRESRHNLTYWTMGEYIGFGQAAASFLEGRRFANPESRADYWQAARRPYQRFQETPPESDKEQWEEYMFLGLRTGRGVSREEFAEHFGEPFPRVWEPVLSELYRQGYAESPDGRIRLTDRGIDVSNIILARFLLD